MIPVVQDVGIASVPRRQYSPDFRWASALSLTVQTTSSGAKLDGRVIRTLLPLAKLTMLRGSLLVSRGNDSGAFWSGGCRPRRFRVAPLGAPEHCVLHVGQIAFLQNS